MIDRSVGNVFLVSLGDSNEYLPKSSLQHYRFSIKLGLLLRTIFQPTNPYYFSVAQQSNSGLGCLNFEGYKPHTHTHTHTQARVC
jgi:hypothetical protein